MDSCTYMYVLAFHNRFHTLRLLSTYAKKWFLKILSHTRVCTDSTDHTITNPSDRRSRNFQEVTRSRAEPMADTEPGSWRGRRSSCGHMGYGDSRCTPAWWWRLGRETPGLQTLPQTVVNSQRKTQMSSYLHHQQVKSKSDITYFYLLTVGCLRQQDVNLGNSQCILINHLMFTAQCHASVL